MVWSIADENTGLASILVLIVDFLWTCGNVRRVLVLCIL